MNCCQCQGIEELFNDRLVSKELSSYRAKGPSKTTRFLIDAIKKAGVQGATLLDIGGGVGAIEHALLNEGVENAMDVDASRAYLKAAQEEARQRGLQEKISFQHGNFVEVASQIPPADIVTLDRVICCFPDMENMVRLSAARARKIYGLVYPRDAWWMKIGMKILNFFLRLQKNPYRGFIHPSQAVEAIVINNGFKPQFTGGTRLWRVEVYSR
jgi:2-polyprenyl-3-methyl-5-hydroxy-6-metoxy-1,4-benzoquinol methylase